MCWFEGSSTNSACRWLCQQWFLLSAVIIFITNAYIEEVHETCIFSVLDVMVTVLNIIEFSGPGVWHKNGFCMVNLTKQ
jgi:hypothetical protein